jgi:hypothetical protein
MKNKRLILLVVVVVAALWHRSDGQAQRAVNDQMRLAGVMPRGALVYAQARDFGALMRAWLASGVRDQFYKSKSHTAFTQSRAYLKLQDRIKALENAVGFGLNEQRLAELAGGLSAVSIYDIGNLEMVFVTELSRDRAIATSLFKLAPQFEERAADGSSYFVREFASDGGRLNQQFCFAHQGNRLILTTTEGLMIRAIRNLKAAADDSLLADVMAIASEARGFAPHEITLWLDQARLNRNRHFNSYWIHRNATTALANIESGLVDFRITPEGMTEQRWFRLVDGGQAAVNRVVNENQVGALMKFAPADAQLVEIHGQGPEAELGAKVSQTFFGKLPDAASSQGEPPDYTRSNSSNDDESRRPRSERYSRLDARFDSDVDDEQATRQGQRAPSTGRSKSVPQEEERFARAVAPILARLAPSAYAEVVRSKADAASPFVRFERAVIVEMKSTAVDRAALERAIMNEMSARYVVAGVEPRLAWQDETSVRFLAQSLLEQGAAYAVSGNYIVMASSKEFARDILRAASAAATSGARVEGALEMYSVLRVASAKPVFDKLMAKLDGPAETSASTDPDEGGENVRFFSQNLSSLISASAIREVRVRRETAGRLMIERVVYSW